MDDRGTWLHIVEVVAALSLRQSSANAPTTGTNGPALLGADLADSPEMYDRLVIATQLGHQTRELETILIHIQWTSREPAVDREQ